MTRRGVIRPRALGLFIVIALCAGCLTPYDPSFDYVSVLRDSPPWGSSPDPSFVPFSYQSASSAELTALEARWSLRAKAASGTSFDRMLALMAWVNDVTTQDGGAPVPSLKTADNFLKLSTDGSGTKLNCLATATTLAEVLLSAGIAARTLTMYPYRASDDCHVVVIAWSNELAKWVFLDPSYNAWFPDSGGAPLSPLEIRQALQSGSGLTVSQGSGWNGGDFDLDYLHYLSKNMYQFYSNQESAAGYEDRGFSRIRVFLTPVGVDPPWIPFVGVRVTHRPEDFFAAPAH